MVANNTKKMCIEYMINIIAPTLQYGLAMWKVTDKSLVYYKYISNTSTQTIRVVVPLTAIERWAGN